VPAFSLYYDLQNMILSTNADLINILWSLLDSAYGNPAMSFGWFFQLAWRGKGGILYGYEEILAYRMKYIDSSGIRKVFALAAQMKDPINFSIGQPDFDTPEAIKREAIQAIEQGVNKYSQTAGDEELLAKIGGSLKTEFGWENKS